jgi:uncharacterized protein YceK
MKPIVISILLATTILFSGCSTVKSILGKSSKAEDKAKAKIELVNTKVADINVKRLNTIGEY